MLHKKLLFETAILITLLFLSSCANHVSPDSASTGKFCITDSLLKNITFDTLRKEPVNSELSLSGKIAFNEDKVSRIYPLVSGHVNDVRVSLGDYVEKGKVLAILESSDMANYYNELKSSQSEVAIAEKNLEVAKNMQSSGVSSDKDYLIAQNEYQKALAQLNKIKEVLKINGSSFTPNDSVGSGYVIKAPISGFIVEKNLTVGMELRPDANESLFTITDLKELWATANVYETDISKIRVGSDAEVVTLSYPDKKFSGKVERISNLLDPDTKVISVKIRIDNKDLVLKPGMFARIAILFPEAKKMFAVKTSSIIYEDNKCYVLKFGGKCDVTIKPVIILKSFNNMNFVESDSLQEGDLLISRNGLFIFTALKSL
jgi:cobalt-zinc-cadmium efflux system membrane fusion protein